MAKSTAKKKAAKKKVEQKTKQSPKVKATKKKAKEPTKKKAGQSAKDKPAKRANLLFPQARDATIQVVNVVDSIRQLAKDFSPEHSERQLIALVDRLADAIEASGHPLAQVEKILAGLHDGLPKCYAGQSEASYHELAWTIGFDVHQRAWVAGDARGLLDYAHTTGGFRRFNTNLISGSPGGSDGAIEHMTAGLVDFDAKWLTATIEDEAERAMARAADGFRGMATLLEEEIQGATAEEPSDTGGTLADETAYVPAHQITSECFGTHSKFKTWLKHHQSVQQKYRGQKLYIHAGDFFREYHKDKEIEFAKLDDPAIEAIVDGFTQQQAEIRENKIASGEQQNTRGGIEQLAKRAERMKRAGK